MAHKLRFGITTRQDLSWPDLVKRWQYIEQLGFDTVWLPDHIVSVFDPSQPMMEGWTALSALATQTTRIRIGLHVTNILFRNPVLLAKQIVTVDHVSNGRLEVALGSGNAAPSYAIAGIAAGTVTERVDRLAEVTEIVHKLLRNEVTTYEGRYYQVKDAMMRPPPVQRPCPPLTIAAHRRSAMNIAATFADTWDSFGGFGLTSSECLPLTRERSRRLDECCVSVGRDPSTLTRSFFAGLVVDSPWSSVEAFRDLIGCYREIGISEFNFRWPATDQLDMFERIAREVLPRLRESGPTSRTVD
ncbi:MAG: LLM class flavin-dependent oxidoreductase [Deltaproteobacteria bacterium]|nr:LLM class flavin-dependent oxidoreductase [Deltaproteobacteria bacterium]